MSDLISRSELTESIKRQYCTGCDNYNGSRCRACHADDMLSLVDDAAAAMPRWISVEERLPEGNGDVIVYVECLSNGHCWMQIAHHVSAYGMDECEDDEWWLDGEGETVNVVTHWMPLPEPPKEPEA